MLKIQHKQANLSSIPLLRSAVTGNTTHQDLCIHFIDVTKDLNSTRLYQISVDGPSVNIKFYNEFIKKHREDCHHQLIRMGSCSLHIIDGALHTGEIKSELDLKHILKGSYEMLHDSPARREDYECVASSKIYPLSFCSTQCVYGSCKLDYLLNCEVLLMNCEL